MKGLCLPIGDLLYYIQKGGKDTKRAAIVLVSLLLLCLSSCFAVEREPEPSQEGPTCIPQRRYDDLVESIVYDDFELTAHNESYGGEPMDLGVIRERSATR